MEHTCLNQGRIATIEERVDNCHKRVFGNGQKGLLDRQSHTEERISSMSEDLTTITANVQALLKHQTTQIAHEKTRDRIRTRTSGVITLIISATAVIVALISK